MYKHKGQKSDVDQLLIGQLEQKQNDETNNTKRIMDHLITPVNFIINAYGSLKKVYINDFKMEIQFH